MPSIEYLTADDVAKAVKQTQACLGITIGKLVPLTEDLYPATLEVAKECFTEDEPICKAFGIQWSDEFRDIWLSVFKENLSFVLVNEENGEIMGIRIIRRLKRGTDKDGSMDVSKFEDWPIKEVIRILQTSFEKAKFYERYDADEAFQFWGLGVPSKYRRRGIATLMMKAGLKFAELLGFESVYIRGGASSNYSKRIYEKLGFETLSEIQFDTYSVNGEFVLKGKTGVHTSLKEYVLIIKNTN